MLVYLHICNFCSNFALTNAICPVGHTTMISKEQRERILSLVRQEVVPAIGCTEPMCVALCTARATEKLGCRPEKIEVQLSANILKNAMGVGIPGTGMTGLPIAIALGALIGKSAYQLEVLKDLTPETLEQGKRFLAEHRIAIRQKEGITEKLYAEVTCTAGGKSASAIIAGGHTRFVDETPQKNANASHTNPETLQVPLNLRLVYDFATTAPLDEIRFILDARTYNMNAAREALKGNYGHNLGKTIDRPRSGNQGICATNPVCVYAKENENTEEELIRALMLSHLTAIYIKQSLGTLSALCGCVVASIGSSCGITYLMGGDYEHICFAVKNMIANLTGMICDGAKPACSLKITSGVSTALLSALLAMEGKCVSSAEGIVDDCVDRSIHNLTSIGADAMCKTDDMVLHIMTSKSC